MAAAGLTGTRVDAVCGAMQGNRFKHFQIQKLLGQGGMGEVYLALDTTLERKVALKFLPRSLMGDPAAQGRLFDEARSCSRIQHPNIAVIHSIEEDGGVYALCLEYVEGHTLREVLADHQLSMNQIARIGRAVAAGMTAAHEQGVIHRDLKPANVMLTVRGEVKIMDFGLALRPQRIVHTMGPNSYGTVSYMSPEQARGETPTHLSDIFSFGSLFYELITSRPPFSGQNDLAVLHKIIQDDPFPIQELRRETPPALERVVRRCMQKDAINRFPSMNDVAAELHFVEPVVESGPKDLILELGSDLSAPDTQEAAPKPSGRVPRPAPRRDTGNVPQDGLPHIGELLTVPFGELEMPKSGGSPSASFRTHMTTGPTKADPRETRRVEIVKEVKSRSGHVPTRKTSRPGPDRAAFIGLAEEASRTYSSGRRNIMSSKRRPWMNAVGLILALALAAAGFITLMRAAGIDPWPFEFPANNEASVQQGSMVTPPTPPPAKKPKPKPKAASKPVEQPAVETVPVESADTPKDGAPPQDGPVDSNGEAPQEQKTGDTGNQSSPDEPAPDEPADQ